MEEESGGGDVTGGGGEDLPPVELTRVVEVGPGRGETGKDGSLKKKKKSKKWETDDRECIYVSPLPFLSLLPVRARPRDGDGRPAAVAGLPGGAQQEAIHDLDGRIQKGSRSSNYVLLGKSWEVDVRQMTIFFFFFFSRAWRWCSSPNRSAAMTTRKEEGEEGRRARRSPERDASAAATTTTTYHILLQHVTSRHFSTHSGFPDIHSCFQFCYYYDFNYLRTCQLSQTVP